MNNYAVEGAIGKTPNRMQESKTEGETLFSIIKCFAVNLSSYSEI